MAYTLQNDVYIGGDKAQSHYHFSNRSIVLNTANGVFTVDVVGNTLSVDTFSITIRHQFDADMIYAPLGKDGYLDTNDKIYLLQKTGVKQYYDFVPTGSDQLHDSADKIFRVFAGYGSGGYLENLPYGTPVYWYVSSKFFAKGYVKTVDRVARYAWKITCISGVGLLDGKYHVGGIYNGTLFRDVVSSIVGGAFRYSIAADVGSAEVYGHLPYDYARNNLHRLLFAFGVALTRGSATNDYVIKNLASSSTYVPDNRIAVNGSVTKQLPATRAEVTEHTYYQMAGDEERVLYDNTGGVAVIGTTVIFRDPVYNLTANGLTILESGVNYAIVSGIGTLTGKVYTHNENIIAINRGGNEAPLVKSVKDNHLISQFNSRNVAKRVMDYYSSAKRLKAKILLEKERTGSNLSLMDAFGEISDAYLEKMTVNVTSVIGATCELVEGYTPKDYGNNYTQQAILKSSGTWTVPTGVTQIRVILIGGGQGGSGGYDGEDGCWFEGGINAPTGGIEEGESRGGMFGKSEQFGYREYGWESGAGCFELGVGYKDGDQREPQGGEAGSPGEPGRYIIADFAVSPGETITVNIGQGGNGGSRNGGVGSAGGATTASSTHVWLSSADGSSSDQGWYDVLSGDTFALPGDNGNRGGNGGMTDTTGDYGTSGTNGRPGGDVLGFRGGKGGKGKITPLQIAYWDEEDNLFFRDFQQKTSGGGGGGAAYGANGGSGANAGFIAGHAKPSDPDTWYGDRWFSGLGGDGANAAAPPQAVNGNGGQGGNGGGGGGNLGGILGFCGYNSAQEHLDLGGGGTEYGGTAYKAGAGGQGSVGGKGGNGLAIFLY